MDWERFSSAFHDNMIIAGAIFFHFNNKVIYKFGASNMAYQHLRPNNLIIWEAIKKYITLGYKEFSFGKTDPVNEGLRRFKLSWGSKEEKIYTYKYDLKNSHFIGVPNQISEFHTKIFSKLPIPLLKLIGAIAYRHMG